MGASQRVATSCDCQGVCENVGVWTERSDCNTTAYLAILLNLPSSFYPFCRSFALAHQVFVDVFISVILIGCIGTFVAQRFRYLQCGSPASRIIIQVANHMGICIEYRKGMGNVDNRIEYTASR